MASKEVQTAEYHGTGLTVDAILSEMAIRAMKGWTLIGVALTFERPVRVEVTVHHDPKSPRGHITKG